MPSFGEKELPLQAPMPPPSPSPCLQDASASPRHPAMQQPYSNDAPRRPGVTPMAAVTTGLLSERLRRAAPCPRTAALTAALEMVARARARTAPAPTSIDFPAWPQRPNLYGQRHPKICINVPTDKQCNDIWAAGKPGRDYLRYYKGASWGGRVAEAQPKADTVLNGEEAVEMRRT